MYDGMKGAMRAEAAFSIIFAVALFVACTASVINHCGPDEEDEEEKEDRSGQYKANEEQPPAKESELPEVEKKDTEAKEEAKDGKEDANPAINE